MPSVARTSASPGRKGTSRGCVSRLPAWPRDRVSPSRKSGATLGSFEVAKVRGHALHPDVVFGQLAESLLAPRRQVASAVPHAEDVGGVAADPERENQSGPHAHAPSRCPVTHGGVRRLGSMYEAVERRSRRRLKGVERTLHRRFRRGVVARAGTHAVGHRGGHEPGALPPADGVAAPALLRPDERERTDLGGSHLHHPPARSSSPTWSSTW